MRVSLKSQASQTACQNSLIGAHVNQSQSNVYSETITCTLNKLHRTEISKHTTGLRRAARSGLSESVTTADELVNDADERLFCKVRGCHCSCCCRCSRACQCCGCCRCGCCFFVVLLPLPVPLPLLLPLDFLLPLPLQQQPT